MTTELELLRDFAERHRLSLGRDGQGDPIVPGRCGHVYAWSGSLLCVMLFGQNVGARKWGNARRAGIAVGMEVLQNGDREGMLRFDPADERRAKTAIKIVGAKRSKRHAGTRPVLPQARVA